MFWAATVLFVGYLVFEPKHHAIVQKVASYIPPDPRLPPHFYVSNQPIVVPLWVCFAVLVLVGVFLSFVVPEKPRKSDRTGRS